MGKLIEVTFNKPTNNLYKSEETCGPALRKLRQEDAIPDGTTAEKFDERNFENPNILAKKSFEKTRSIVRLLIMIAIFPMLATTIIFLDEAYTAHEIRKEKLEELKLELVQKIEKSGQISNSLHEFTEEHPEVEFALFVDNDGMRYELGRKSAFNAHDTKSGVQIGIEGYTALDAYIVILKIMVSGLPLFGVK